MSAWPHNHPPTLTSDAKVHDCTSCRGGTCYAGETVKKHERRGLQAPGRPALCRPGHTTILRPLPVTLRYMTVPHVGEARATQVRLSRNMSGVAYRLPDVRPYVGLATQPSSDPYQ